MSDGWESPDGSPIIIPQYTAPRPSNGNAHNNATPWGEDTYRSQTFTRSRGRGFRGSRGQRGGRGRQDSAWGSENGPPTAAGGSWRQDNNWRMEDGRGGRGGGRGRGGAGSYGGRGEESVMDVPSCLVGKIIGRGGSKIQELQTESGARIVITKEEHEDQTVIKISGQDESVRKAKTLIEELVDGRRTNHYGSRSSASSGDAVIKIPMNFNWQELSDECDRTSREKWAKCPPLIKDFYCEHPAITSLSDAEVHDFREQSNNIVVSRIFGDKVGYKTIPKPVRTFEECFAERWPDILQEVYKMGFEKPSPIQSQAWPVLLSGDDMIGIAQTGTGKTLAFLLPALIHIEGQSSPRGERGGPNVLIMAPTRELALQIEKEVKKYNYRGIKAVCVYGGGNRKEQVNVVTNGVEIVIATPGRLNDLVQAGYLDVSSITYLVLDEADRMLDMGFEPQIRKILLDIRPDRQTVMTSATWPPGVRRLAQSYMDNPVQVYVGSLDLAAVHSVTQTILLMEDDEDEKFRTFINWVNVMQPEDKVIVFCGKKARADYITTELLTLGIDCQSIHGDREQTDREQALLDITDGRVQILIATDVASRGIDIQDISHVINYDFPRNIEEYVHRVGRTGRAGRTGESISYFTRADWSSAKELIDILNEADQYVPEQLYAMSKRYEAWKAKKDLERGNRGGRSGFRRW